MKDITRETYWECASRDDGVVGRDVEGRRRPTLRRRFRRQHGLPLHEGVRDTSFRVSVHGKKSSREIEGRSKRDD